MGGWLPARRHLASCEIVRRMATTGREPSGIAVRKAGLLTTVQDTGRWGFQRFGVPVAGPMDIMSHRAANLLVGNAPSAATLEVTIAGPEFDFQQDARFAVTGAVFDVRLDDAPIPNDAAVRARTGQRLVFGRCRRGARAYIAVAGGIAVPLVLGSRATHLGSRMGGVDGRAICSGDLLPIGRGATWAAATARFRWTPRALPDGGARIRVLMGPHHPRFDPRSIDAFSQERYVVTPQSDRMGYRLRGAPLTVSADGALLSTATPPGAIQVPPLGEPILLMADRQTAGGYPRIATVITSDIPVVAQLAPGDWIEFAPCDQATALRALIADERSVLVQEGG